MDEFDVLGFVREHFQRGPAEWHYKFDVVLKVLELAEANVSRQPALLELSPPLIVCGDIHGQYSDLLHIFQQCGMPFNTRYLFLGDYVDRGTHSLETILLLLACRVQFPDNVYLLRGNHEIQSVNKSYGFLSELRMRFHQDKQWDRLSQRFADLFGHLPVAALVNRRILCVHGGLAPSLTSIEEVRRLRRPQNEPSGLMEDILWADPAKDCAQFAKNSDRGCSFTYGNEAVKEIFTKLGIELLVRAHQVVDHGYEYFANRRVVTLFSAPGYSDFYENLGAVMKMTPDGSLSFYQFSASPPVDRSRSLFVGIPCTE